MLEILELLRSTLTDNGNEKIKASSQRFFKNEIKAYGIKLPVLKTLIKPYNAELKHLPKPEIFNLCEELWKSQFFEEGIVACHWSLIPKKKFEGSDLKIFEKWITQYIDNWATCDTFCNHTVGTLLLQFPQCLDKVMQWSKMDHRWAQRASAVSLIVPARKGYFLKESFEIASMLLSSEDDMVQKGYGWLLKVQTKHHENEVFKFVIKHKAIMPRTALRYAIEKMPDELKKKAMEK